MGTFLYLIPELILVTTALVVILEMVHLRRVSEPTRVPIYTAIVGLLATVVAGVVTLSFVPGSEVVADHLALFGRFFVPLIGLGLIGSARGQRTTHAAEYIGVMLLALVGLMIVFQASDLVLLLVALELISIPTYVLLFLRSDRHGGDGGDGEVFFLGDCRVGGDGLRDRVCLRRDRRDAAGGDRPVVKRNARDDARRVPRVRGVDRGRLVVGRSGIQDGGRAVSLLRAGRL